MLCGAPCPTRTISIVSALLPRRSAVLARAGPIAGGQPAPAALLVASVSEVSGSSGAAERDAVQLTNLDQPLFEGAGATKRDLVEYLDGVRELILPELEDRPLSVIRVHRGQEAFMQKNVPKYTPAWVRTVQFWAETSKREVSYALCNDRRTLLWFANQRAVEYHPTLGRADQPDRTTHLVLDLDPPDPAGFPMAVRAAHLVRQALADARLQGGVKTSGAKGVHVFVPIDHTVSAVEAALATRGPRCSGCSARSRGGHHRVYEGGPGGEGFRRCHPGRRGDCRLGLQPANSCWCPGFVPCRLGRARWRGAQRLHRAHSP